MDMSEHKLQTNQCWIYDEEIKQTEAIASVIFTEG